MRVLMTTDTVSGVWTHALDLCRGLTEHGVEVELAAMGPNITVQQQEDAQAITGVQLHYLRGRLEWMDEPWADVDASLRWARELAHERGVDLVHANTLSHGALDPDLPTLVAGHSCVTSWFEAVKKVPAPIRYDVYRQRVSHALHLADLVVAPTATMLAALARHHGPFPRSTVVFNGRCFDDFEPGDKQPYVFGAGRLWDEAKNAAAVVEVAGRWPWRVYLAGATRSPEGGDVELSGVELLGDLRPTDVARWMGGASIFVSPARYEPFGLTALEAAASGCALVLGAIPSLYEVWGSDAFFVSPDHPKELADAVEALIFDPVRREELAHAGRTRALHMHHRRMAAGYLGLYEELLTVRGRSRSSASSSHPMRSN